MSASEYALVAFYSQNTFGQWVVYAILGMLVFAVLGAVSWAAEHRIEAATVFGGALWGAIVFWVLIVLFNLLMAFITLLQWLWFL